jgi:hypothetical protein
LIDLTQKDPIFMLFLSENVFKNILKVYSSLKMPVLQR